MPREFATEQGAGRPETLGRLADYIWRARYRAGAAETNIRDSWERIANAAAAVDKEPQRRVAEFMTALASGRFLPGGRILAGAGMNTSVTLANCFVMGRIDDSLVGVFDAAREAALTLQQGGGVGLDFSTLRPRGSPARATDSLAAGPVAFIRVFDTVCAAITSTGSRGGAMMATLRCDHADIEAFIRAKQEPGVLRNCNLSVLVSDEFMRAVQRAESWPLVFPVQPSEAGPAAGATIIERPWGPGGALLGCRLIREVPAVSIWDALAQNAHACGDPGVLFVDRINAANNLGYCEYLTATNPCGEAPLPPYGACHLGSLNLARFVDAPFASAARVNTALLGATTATAVRFLDNIVEISRYPLARQFQAARATRRIGIGITGLADALAMLGERYDSARARELAVAMLTVIRDHAYRASVDLAAERGPFPSFQADKHLHRPFLRSLPAAIRDAIARHGIRNSHLLAIAPAGSISLLANNVSSGIEPIRALTTVRTFAADGGDGTGISASDYAFEVWRAAHGAGVQLPAALVDPGHISAHDQLLMQSALQPLVDGAISKTVVCDPDTTPEQFRQIFSSAYELGLKGTTAYRLGERSEPMRCSGVRITTNRAKSANILI
jgi:ribonucleoside-diphosphate reductase alpha chain